MSNYKLTKKGMEVLKFLNKPGCTINANNTRQGSLITDTEELKVNLCVFARLEHAGLIYQSSVHPFDFFLTEKGEEIIK